MLYRGFGYLHARVLLALQCDIEVLERKLDKLDEWEHFSGDKDKLSCKQRDDSQSTPNDVSVEFNKTRPQVIAELKLKLMEYGSFSEYR